MAATQDVSSDALTLETVRPERRRFVGGVQIAGVYLGSLAAVAGWVPLYQTRGWALAMLAMAALTLLIAGVAWVGTRRFRTVIVQAEAGDHPSIWRALRRPVFRKGLLFMLAYQLGGRFGFALLGPYLVDAGLSLSEIALLTGAGLAISGIGGAVAGGMLIARLGLARVLLAFGLCHGLVFIALAVNALSASPAKDAAAALVIVEGIVFALSYVPLYVKMMDWSAPEQPGTDFSLLQSADSLLAILAGAAANGIAGMTGYPVLFAASAVLLIAAALAVPALSTLVGTSAVRQSPVARFDPSCLEEDHV